LVGKHFGPYFTWVVTWCYGADEKYRKAGCQHVLKSHIGVNPEIYHPTGTQKDIDVGFVGTFGPPRKKVIDALRAAGINVAVRGAGWPEGSVSQKEMVDIFSRSKMVLSLNVPPFYLGFSPIARLFFRKPTLGEGGSSIKLDIKNFFWNVKSLSEKRKMTIRARNFEVPACRTLLLTEDAENLKDFYVPDREIVIYKGADDLIEKARYYLSHPEEREEIARCGYERTLHDHTIEIRLNEVFSTIGRPL
jgi:spore maturation protein CgeB